MTDHIEKAAKDEYETTTSGSWDDATFDSRVVYYSSAQRIVGSYLASLSSEVAKSQVPHTNRPLV